MRREHAQCCTCTPVRSSLLFLRHGIYMFFVGTDARQTERIRTAIRPSGAATCSPRMPLVLSLCSLISALYSLLIVKYTKFIIWLSADRRKHGAHEGDVAGAVFVLARRAVRAEQKPRQGNVRPPRICFLCLLSLTFCCHSSSELLSRDRYDMD